MKKYLRIAYATETLILTNKERKRLDVSTATFYNSRNNKRRVRLENYGFLVINFSKSLLLSQNIKKHNKVRRQSCHIKKYIFSLERLENSIIKSNNSSLALTFFIKSLTITVV